MRLIATAAITFGLASTAEAKQCILNKGAFVLRTGSTLKGQSPHEIILLLPSPTFDLFLTRDRVARPIKTLIVDEPIAAILPNETTWVGVRVKPQSGLQTVRHAGVKNGPAAIADHVNIERFHFV